MRKLILKMSMSLDAFVAGPNGELDWLFKNSTPSSKQWVHDTIVDAGVHIMGSKSYNDMKTYWPFSNDLLADAMNDIPKVVFTRKGIDAAAGTTTAIQDAIAADKAEGVSLSTHRDKQQSWDRATIASGDMAEEIKKLKAQHGNFILAHGGAGFARSLVKTGLIDEYQLLVHPIILGKGLPIFSELESRTELELVSSKLFGNGLFANIYRPK